MAVGNTQTFNPRTILLTEKGPAKIWVDPKLPQHDALSAMLIQCGAAISASPDDTKTSIIVLHPSSTGLFDRYCHPAWLSMAGRFRRIRRTRAGEAEEWKRKVVVTEQWPSKCLDAGRYLGEGDRWGGCRKGGPPKITSTPVLTPPTRDGPGSAVEPSLGSTVREQTASNQTAPHPIGPTSGENARPIAGLPQRPRAVPTSPKARPLPSQPTMPQPPQRRPKSRSILLPANHKPLNAPTSKWQASTHQPPKILRGLRFYLEGGRFGRRHTMSNIEKSSGRVLLEPIHASYCLLSPVPPAEAQKRRTFIRQAAAAGAWCVAYEFLEQSWDAGRLLDELDFVYEGGIPKHVSKARGVGSSNIAIPNIQLPAPKTVISNPAVTQSYQRFPHIAGRYSTGGLDEFIREAHILSLRPNGGFHDVARHLHETRGYEREQTWEKLYRSWLDMSDRFSPCAAETGYTAYIPIFERCLPDIRGGATFREIVAKIEATRSVDLPSGSLSIHLGNWLRTVQPAPATFVPPQGRESSSVRQRSPLASSTLGTGSSSTAIPDDDVNRSETQHQVSPNLIGAYKETVDPAERLRPGLSGRPANFLAKGEERKRQGDERKLALATIFKRDYENTNLGAAKIALEIAATTNYHAPSITVWLSQWRNRDPRWAGIPAELQPARSGQPRNPEKHSNQKRKREISPAASDAAKRSKVDLTNSEEALMAGYIARRGVKPAEAVEDWREFALKNPARSVEDWVEHYRLNRIRIDDLVGRLGGRMAGRQQDVQTAGTGGAVGGAEERQAYEMGPGAVEVVDLCFSSDEEN